MLEVLILIFLATLFHFIRLTFHNKQNFNSKTFLKASIRIVTFIVIAISALVAFIPKSANSIEAIPIIFIIGYIIFFCFYFKDYGNKK